MKIYTSTCNRPELIEVQLRSFQKHIKDNFELIVLNNSYLDVRKRVEYARIEAECDRLGLNMFDVWRDPKLVVQSKETYPIFRGDVYAGPNAAAQYADNWAWKHLISKETGPVMLVHPDVFAVRDFDPCLYLDMYHLSFISQSRPGAGEYMHDALVLADISKLPDVETVNWCAGQINGVLVDGGGQTYHYLQGHPDLDLFRIRIEYPILPGRDAYPPPDYEMFGFGLQPEFLHYRSVSNWNHQPEHYHRDKIAWLKETLERS